MKKKNDQGAVAADYPFVCAPLKKREKWTYALGNVGTDLTGAVVMSYMLFFYTNVLGISAAVAGMIFLFSRILDAATDLLMGWILDRTRTRWGKARPWLLWMCVPCMICTAAMFFVPNMSTTGKIIYAVITYNLAGAIAGTACTLPYNTLAGLATDNIHDRAQIGVFRLVGTVGIGVIANLILFPTVNLIGGSDNSASGWFFTLLIFSVIACACTFVTFLGTKERIGAAVEKQEIVPIKKALPSLLKNKFWVILLFINIIVQLVGGAITMRPYYAIYLLGSSDYVGIMTVAVMLPMVLAMVFIVPLIKKFGKVRTAMAGLALGVFAYILQALAPANLTMVLVSYVVRGLAMAVIAAPLNSIMPDVIDHEEWRTGMRAEGLANSAVSFAAKCGAGLASAIMGWILTIGKFDSELTVQPQSSIDSIIFGSIYLPMILYGIGFILLMFFGIDKIYPKIIKELQARKAGYISTLKYSEITALTPEKKDRRLAFVNLIPKGVMEKKMRENLPGMRADAPSNPDILRSGIKITDYNIPGYNGEITVRLFMPESAGKRSLTVFFHGGAFIGGRMSGTSNYCAAYADKMNEAVLSVDYHLAPDNPFPHGLEDCYNACKWAFKNAEVLNIDADKITVSGDSAGGNFAAVIALMAKEKQEFSIAQLILIYPYITFADPKLNITKIMHEWYINGEERTNPLISPLEGDVAGLPPTITFICEYDLLAESGKDFAEKLAASGVDSTCVMFKKTRHAFLDKMDSLKQTEDLLVSIKEWKDSLSGQQAVNDSVFWD